MDSGLKSDQAEYEELFEIEGEASAGGGLIEDPWPAWTAALAKGAVLEGSLAECMGLPPEMNGGGLYDPARTYYSVFSFAAVSEVFTRKDDFWSDVYNDMGTSQEFGETILSLDGISHRRYRDVLQPFFQPPVAETWWREKVIDPMVTELVESIREDESIDINTRFFARLPLHTMTGGFGLSHQEGLELRRHMQAGLKAKTMEDRLTSREQTSNVLKGAILEKRENPSDDLISHLAHAEITDDDGTERKLTHEEITNHCRLIVFAGGETTWRQMGNALFALLNHPEQLAEVIADRSLLAQAVLESVRWNPDPTFPRKVKRDTVLAGVELPEGAHLHLCLAAANHDPSRWDNPEVFDIHRPFKRSVAFAAGAHSCLGQHVARQEIIAALSALFDNFPNIRWDSSKPTAKITGSIVQRGPGPLHVLLH
ncbi:MAG: cytochrome P450 [Novosphingobium sp.]|nr:cytochrome P450 [Novosphingobium sp.]